MEPLEFSLIAGMNEKIAHRHPEKQVGGFL
jgi:hypothetical protein